jgi:hypothetical protein
MTIAYRKSQRCHGYMICPSRALDGEVVLGALSGHRHISTTMLTFYSYVFLGDNYGISTGGGGGSRISNDGPLWTETLSVASSSAIL